MDLIDTFKMEVPIDALDINVFIADQIKNVAMKYPARNLCFITSEATSRKISAARIRVIVGSRGFTLDHCFSKKRFSARRRKESPVFIITEGMRTNEVFYKYPSDLTVYEYSLHHSPSNLGPVLSQGEY